MADKAYIVKFKPSALGVVQTVVASTVEIHDEHLIFCNAKGEPSGAVFTGDRPKLERDI